MDNTQIKIKHLEMIQDAIKRMSSNSFSIKNWAITITVAIVGLSKNDTFSLNPCAAIYVIMMFWLLDAFYLFIERKYTNLFGRVDRGDPLYDESSNSFASSRNSNFIMDTNSTIIEYRYKWIPIGKKDINKKRIYKCLAYIDTVLSLHLILLYSVLIIFVLRFVK